MIEGQLRSIGKALEAVDFQALKPHAVTSLPRVKKTKAAPRVLLARLDPEAAGFASVFFVAGGCDVTTKTVRSCPHPTQSGMAPEPDERPSV
jgi:hypothetical protein